VILFPYLSTAYEQIRTLQTRVVTEQTVLQMAEGYSVLGLIFCEPGSSVSIVSGYGLDDRAFDVRSRQRRKDFCSSLCPDRLWAHTASCTMATGVLSPRLMRGQGLKLTAHPYFVPRSRGSRSYTSSPPSAFMACSETALGLIFYYSSITKPSGWLTPWCRIYFES
jgi:hypothetical protein